MRKLGELGVVLAGLSMVLGCGGGPVPEPMIRVERAWVRPAPGPADSSSRGGNSAAYFTVINDGGSPDTLIGVLSDAAVETDLHESRTEGGIARMLPVARVVVPAGGRLAFEPGGYHVMLTGVKHDLHVGEDVRLMMRFRKSGIIVVYAQVRGEGYQ